MGYGRLLGLPFVSEVTGITYLRNVGKLPPSALLYILQCGSDIRMQDSKQLNFLLKRR
jgi:hypothetical protein